MAGGTWAGFNKVRPGVYVNTVGTPRTIGNISDRGIAALPLNLPWGADGLITLDSDTYQEQALAKIGFYPSDPRIRHITACMEHVRRLVIYRIDGEGATKATATQGTLTVTALYGGVRGNDITVSIADSLDEEGAYEVTTYLEGEEVDLQTVTAVEELQPNSFVTFAGTGVLEPTAGINLTGGQDGTVTAGSYSKAFSAFETEEFNTLGVPSEDDAVKALAVSYTKRLREEVGKKITTVLADYPQADYEGVISLKNSIITTDGLQVPIIYMLCEITGMVAAARVNESLTYRAIQGAADALPRYSNAEIEQALRNGELVLVADGGRVRIEQDINTFTSYTPTKGREFSKNRVVRVLDSINNDFSRVFKDFYIGKIDNNDDGRNLLKNEAINYLDTLQGMGAIQEFSSQTDVTVSPIEGHVDSVYIETYVKPTDSIEKIYVRVTVR